MLTTWPQGGWQLNVELGPIPSEYIKKYGLQKASAIYRPTRPRVDAVKWTDNGYYLIESKLRDIKNGIGDLAFYQGMALQAPDLPYYDKQPIKLRLVVPWMIDWIRAAAEAANVEVIIFKPDWIDDYVKEKQHYFTSEYRAQRAEIKRLREILGVD